MDRTTHDLPMRCFTWEAGEISDGIRVSGTPERGHYCSLGDPKTPGPAVRIALHKGNPPAFEGELFYEAFPFWVRPRDTPRFLVLAAPHEKHVGDGRCLLRISTHNEETYGGRGFWRATEGRTNTIATGLAHYVCAHGRKAVASHGLVILEPNQVLRVRAEGSDTHWAVRYADGTLQSDPWEQYQASLYMEIR
jgi:hypothetical protein